MADKMSAMAAVRAGYAASARPLGVARTFDENARGPVRTSDIVISATAIAALPSGATTLATVPAGENWRIDYLSARNTTGTDYELRVFLVPAGGGASSAANGVFVGTITAGSTKLFSEVIGYHLASGEVLAMVGVASSAFIAFGRLTRITQGAT